jgi:hypothetical protein
LREGAVRFLARWLQGQKIEVFEDDDVSVLTDAELQVTPKGQARWLPGARSIFEIFADSEKQLAKKRPKLTRKVVREVTGIRAIGNLPKPEIEDAGGDFPKKLVIRPEPGIALPALHWPGGEEVPVLLAPGDGMNSAVAQARKLHEAGHPVLIVEVRDTGETQTQNWRFYGADSYIGQMLGRSWMTMRSEDLIVCARWLAEEFKRESVNLDATGECVPAALHARFLEPELIGRVTVRDGLTSWRQLMTDREPHTHIHQAVHGALQFYDLPNLKSSE